MSPLQDLLYNRDIGVRSSSDGLHILVSLLEHLHTVADIVDVVVPTVTEEGVAVVGVGTVAGLGLAVAGPVLGMAGVFMALGSGYEEARQLIQNDAIAGGFSQGFVAGLLNMSGGTVRSLFAEQGVIHRNAFDPDADVLEMKAHNRGLVAGYALAEEAEPDEKKEYLSELREFTGNVSAGDWTDRDKIDYVIAYAAKLRLNFLESPPDAT